MAVVFMHSLAVLTPPDAGASRFTVAGLLYQLLLWATPTFAVLSGFVLFNSHPEVSSAPEFYRKRLPVVLLPFLAWSLTYLGLFGQPGKPHEVLLHWLLGMAGQRHLYFLAMVVQFYLAFPWIAAWVRSRPSWLSLALGLLVSGGWQAWFAYAQAPRGWESVWWTSHALLPAWLFYLFLGGALARHQEWLRERLLTGLRRSAVVCVSLAVLGLALVVGEFILPGNGLHELSSHRPLVLLLTPLMLPLLALLALRAADSEHYGWLRGLAGVSFGVYILHPLALWFMDTALPPLETALRYPLLLTGCVGLTALFLFLLRVHPLTARLCGMKVQEAHPLRPTAAPVPAS